MLAIVLVWFVHCLLVLLTVAFFTLFERKVIGLVHLRLGPNKTLLYGLFQPLLDAFKLLSKQNLESIRSNKLTYSTAPTLSLALSLIFWILIPLSWFTLSNSYSLVVFITIGSVIVLINLFSGWSSNSKYSFIGSLRSVAQSVSYEAVFTTIILALIISTGTYSIQSASASSRILIWLLLPIWFFSTLAETHRAPFDFSESESELVSGYNTEYSGALFAFCFLSEYSSLLFSSAVIYFLFLRFIFGTSPLAYTVGTLLLATSIILVRVTFCRFRYDKLITTAWKSLLPLSLLLLMGSFVFL